jgi:phthiocerol/phenolphthiocerol synthesis type-I polyketide synthase E
LETRIRDSVLARTFKVVSKPTVAENGAADEWQPFSISQISYVDTDPPAQENLTSIIERCNRKEIVIRDDDKIDPDLGPRWQSLQRVYVGDKELLATLELPEMFAADMPMGYKRLQVKGPLPRRIHAYISAKDSGSRNETITFDITLFDEEGVERVVIESFSQKRVNDATGTIKLLAGTSARKDNAIEAKTENGAQAEGADAIYQKSLSEGVSPEEGVEAFRRILAHTSLPQIIVSTKDLHASIEQVSNFAMLLEETDELNESVE